MPFFNLRVEHKLRVVPCNLHGGPNHVKKNLKTLEPGTLLGLTLCGEKFVIINETPQLVYCTTGPTVQQLFDAGYFTCFKMEQFDRLPKKSVTV